jgi:hypothetical protein
VSVLDGSGRAVGSIALSVSGRGALLRVRDEAAAGHALEVRVESVKLTAAASKDRLKVLTKRLDRPVLYVTVDVLGAADSSPRVEPDANTFAASIRFAKTYSLERGSALRSAAVAALRSEDQTDSEVIIVLMAAAKDGKREEEIGVARHSLEALLETGKEMERVPLEVRADNGKGGVVGEAVVSIRGLAALRDVDDEADGRAPAKAGAKPGAKPSDGATSERALRRAATEAAAKQTLALGLSTLTLLGRVARKRPARVHVAVDVLGALQLFTRDASASGSAEARADPPTRCPAATSPAPPPSSTAPHARLAAPRAPPRSAPPPSSLSPSPSAPSANLP